MQLTLTQSKAPTWAIPSPRVCAKPAALSYHAFAAAYAHYGREVALRCAVTYGCSLHQALIYTRRYAIEGYSV